ncbi:hypothetical protein CCR75_002299 [Bremia lactucae]|uniref:Uncharacterized protein n=1 Tax=Bremia lactucae TaxID=4779 RepID=A0A976FGR9_BRELC|nr:hypothetical protein CCR75_002299 [Bremia lactucae]
MQKLATHLTTGDKGMPETAPTDDTKATQSSEQPGRTSSELTDSAAPTNIKHTSNDGNADGETGLTRSALRLWPLGATSQAESSGRN